MRTLLDLLVRIAVNGVALWLAALVVDGVTFGDPNADFRTSVTTLLVIGLVFGIVNTFVKPILDFFGAPLKWLTLGLFGLVINAWMLQFTSWLCQPQRFDLPFQVDDFFWSAVFGAVVVTFVSMIISLAMPIPDRRR